MYQDERLEIILKHLKEKKRMKNEEIYQILDASKDTIRRDLIKLEEQNLIVRIRGGAKLYSFRPLAKNYNERLLEASKEKELIGKQAAKLVNEGEKVIFESSTTVLSLAKNIDKKCDIITNSIDIAQILCDNEVVNVNILGGKLNKKHKFFYGPSTIDSLSKFHVNKVFLGVLGINEEGLFQEDENEGYMLKKMIEISEKVIVLVDNSKINKKGFFKFCELSQVDTIITDKEIDKKLMEVLKSYEIEIIIASDEK